MSRDIYEYGDTEALNNPILPADGGMPEGIIRDAVNQGHREMMGAIRRYYDDPEWIRPRIQGPLGSQQGVFTRISATQFQINLAFTDLTGWFQPGRIIKIVDGGGAGIDLTTQVVSSSYLSSVTTVNITSTDSMDVASSDAYSFFSSIVRKLALFDSNAQFFIPATADAAGINAAIVAADAAGGGTVFLTESLYNLEAAITFGAAVGRIRMIGAGPEVILRENAGAAITPLLTLDSATEAVHIENVIFDKGTNSKTGTIISVDGALRPKIENCVFIGGTDQIAFTATTTSDVSIIESLFVQYTHNGIIAGPSPTAIHSGHITGNRFDSSLVASADPAAIKVSGQWTIDANSLTNIGDPSLNSRGIWLWNESADNGAFRSVVTGNRISGDNSANGTMIEVGCDSVVVSGNRIAAPSAGRGIFVNGTQAGQIITDVAIDGNVCTNGTGIETNQRTADVTISGNSIRPVVDGIVLDGFRALASGNDIAGGARSIVMSTNSDGSSAVGNSLYAPTTSFFDIDGADAAISRNVLRGSATNAFNYQSASTGSRVHQNEIFAVVTNVHNFTPSLTTPTGAAQFNDQSALDPATPNDQGLLLGTNSNISTAEVILFGPVDMPGELGTGRFDLAWSIVNNLGLNTNDVRIRIGPTGTLADPVFATTLVAGGGTWNGSGTHIEQAMGHQILISGDDGGGSGTGSNLTVTSFSIDWKAFV